MNGNFTGRGALTSTARMYRDLRSDLLLIYPVGAGRWVQFRDVFEVDGQSVRDRNDRLANLFLKPSPSLAAQVNRIQDESSRYNIGALERTVNVPLLPLIFLNPALQARFTFTRELSVRRKRSACGASRRARRRRLCRSAGRDGDPVQGNGRRAR